MPRTRRFDLRHHREVFTQSRWKRGKLIDILLFPFPVSSSAVIVGNVSGYPLVKRNRLKRQLRELAREEIKNKNNSPVIIIRAKRTTYDATFQDIKTELSHLVSAARH
ncbi:hypothetical protein C5B42_02730 [Candidatus Cerribacteria bacterium 'Amazon FNV 2010 28 9']|uniref:Uncharacterized protein n=1 Tax=Candidatus Cerribacteria bacterium 'Amazon FNV 2010 28 9' TaxID=2081795 RepID=A0A317JNS9_9BACT|nr:MAG: hypothetical protein C5B42_02730 [Candidatus Cerribacteria bacterium 'Amazon FNV 2010 28 9']